MFPPGNASAQQALEAHLGYRSSAVAPYVGPLLVSVDRWTELGAAHAAAGRPKLEVVQIGDVAVPGPLPAGVRLRGVEVPVTSLPLPDPGPALTLAAELTAGAGLKPALAAVATGPGRYLAKFRTGGTTRDAFPDEVTLARFLTSAVDAGAPFKLTAGLHGAVRSTAPATGFEQHGFLNVLWAVDVALSGGDERSVAAVLAERDADVVAGAVLSLSPQRRRAVRRSFVSFGCCGVLDPLRDLHRLGLLRLPDSPSVVAP